MNVGKQRSGPAGRSVMALSSNGYKPQPGDVVKSPLGYGRETVESIVVAFTLALLFRAFEAEAFVIPTGSMAPTLMGRHKDVVCEKCDRDYRVGCSAEEDDQSQSLRSQQSQLTRELADLRTQAKNAQSPQQREAAQRRVEILESDRGPLAQIRTRLGSKLVPATRCPSCGYAMRLIEDAKGVDQPLHYLPQYPSFNGDRILVNKFIYDFVEPNRWDVVVFRYPEDAKTNYIKRLIGLPNETVSIVGGDIWTSQNAEPPRIARKPVTQLLAMLQCVFDSRYLSPELHQAGWPLGWIPWSPPAESATGRWTTADSGRSFACSPAAEAATLRYRHFFPTAQDWEAVNAVLKKEPAGALPFSTEIQPALVDDFQPYNALATRSHWVGDLAVEMQLENRSAAGTFSIDLVEAGQAHRCTIDLAIGAVQLAIAGQAAEDSPQARTPLHGLGSWRILFANVDDELSLFIDGVKVEFDRPTAWSRSIEAAQAIRPTEVAIAPGTMQPSDLSPVGVTAVGADLRIDTMRVLRDIFYIGAHDIGARPGELIERQLLEFPLEEDQFFVLGDNSAASKDSRLWVEGYHVNRELLVGKALVIFWPHAVPAQWSIPLTIGGSQVRLPAWPNFARMGYVR